MADSPQLPDEIDPRGRWYGIGSRTSEDDLIEGEAAATEAEPEDNGSYNVYVLPTYRVYTRAERRDAIRRASAASVGYLRDMPPTRIADEGLETPINQDGYVYGPDPRIAAAGAYTAAMSRGPTKPYAGQPPSAVRITQNVAAQSRSSSSSGSTGPGGFASMSDADLAAAILRGDGF